MHNTGPPDDEDTPATTIDDEVIVETPETTPVAPVEAPPEPIELEEKPFVPPVGAIDGRAATPRAGNVAIKDIGAMLWAEKPGAPTFRTDAMMEEIIDRLEAGQSLLSISYEPHLPAYRTLMLWQRNDPDLKAAWREARAEGQHLLQDAKMDVAMRGRLSSDDTNRDRLIVECINSTISKRNRADFGDAVKVDQTMRIETVVLPMFALGPRVDQIAAGEFVEVEHRGDYPDPDA